MRGGLILVIVAMLALVACSQTKVITLDDQKQPSTTDTTSATPDTTTPETQPVTGGASVATGGKTIKTCEDTDGNDATTIGRVLVTYDDGTTDNFYDDCAGGSNVEVEYFCVGNALKSKNTICKSDCTLINIKSDPGKQAGMCFKLQ